jgi:hypothetical protein
MERNKSNINFNFTPEQQAKFNLILKETKELYPHLVGDDVSLQRTKVLIAYTVINGDEALKIKENVVVEEDIISNNNIEDINGEEK